MTIAAQPSPGILDVADGVQRVMGDRGLYQRMLRRFCDDYVEGAAPIRRAIAGGDLLLARRLAHTLKGAAGMIGAAAVHGQAALLEAALSNSCPPHINSLATLDVALAAVARAVGHLLAGTQTQAVQPAAPARAPRVADMLLVAQLTDLLDRGDGAALDLLEQSEGMLRAALGEPVFCAVARAAREFDFESALVALRPAED
jgi:HPt (histidine-containing phosphotransfer) domain-containing protein